MMTLLAAVAVLTIGWWLVGQVSTANPALLARRIKQAGGVAALGIGGLLLVRGRFDMAMFAGATAAWLFGWSHPRLPGFQRAGVGGTGPRAGARSRVRSATIEMEMDHDTGDLSGEVLAGLYAGRRLADLPEPDLIALLNRCRSDDLDGARLLEAYLDRRFPRWGEHADRDRDPRPGPYPERGRMSEQEAYEVLGLQPGAPGDEIRRAHRNLMKRLHPDGGGSTYLASRVNQAKDVLVDRHR